jgi:hypothetical protein
MRKNMKLKSYGKHVNKITTPPHLIVGVFNVVFHQVRDPLRVVRSLPTMFPGAFRFIAKVTPKEQTLVDLGDFSLHPLVIAMQHYVSWNRLVGHIAQVRYQLETVKYDDLCTLAGFSSSKCAGIDDIKLPPTVHARQSYYANATWPLLFQLHQGLASQLWAMAHEYGYTYDEARPWTPLALQLAVPWPLDCTTLFEEKREAKVRSYTRVA